MVLHWFIYLLADGLWDWVLALARTIILRLLLLICSSLIAKETGNFLEYLLSICVSSFENCLLSSLASLSSDFYWCSIFSFLYHIYDSPVTRSVLMLTCHKLESKGTSPKKCLAWLMWQDLPWLWAVPSGSSADKKGVVGRRSFAICSLGLPPVAEWICPLLLLLLLLLLILSWPATPGFPGFRCGLRTNVSPGSF